jgi:hypothetical protein
MNRLQKLSMNNGEEDKTIVALLLYDIYKNNSLHVTVNDVETIWKKQAPSSGFESTLCNEDLQTERIGFFVGICNWPYMKIGKDNCGLM